MQKIAGNDAKIDSIKLLEVVLIYYGVSRKNDYESYYN